MSGHERSYPEQESALLPCPFCGKPPLLYVHYDESTPVPDPIADVEFVVVRCSVCGISKQTRYRSDAIHWWNKRCGVLAQGSGDCGAWQPIETRPEIDHQPGRQFILIEGSCDHSGVSWYRQFAGEAWIRKPGGEDEMLQYRKSDVLRICKDGDIDPHTAKVTHWMPGAYPFFPSSVSSTEVK